MVMHVPGSDPTDYAYKPISIDPLTAGAMIQTHGIKEKAKPPEKPSLLAALRKKAARVYHGTLSCLGRILQEDE